MRLRADVLYDRWVIRVETKIEALLAYGGIQCAHCGIDDLRVLTLDHIAQDGWARRHAGEPAGSRLYGWLRKRGYPPGFRVLCYNCNIIAYCEHKERQRGYG